MKLTKLINPRDPHYDVLNDIFNGLTCGKYDFNKIITT